MKEMNDISIKLYSQKDNYKGIQEFFKFFLNYVKPDRMRIVASLYPIYFKRHQQILDLLKI